MSVDTRTVSSDAEGKPQEAKSRPVAVGSLEEQGLRVARHWTRAGTDPLDEVTYELRDSVITNPDGSIVFEMRGAEIPESWSQLATDIAVSKYFRKAGLKGDSKKGETSARQLVYRVARTFREAGEEMGGYFATKEDADARQPALRSSEGALLSGTDRQDDFLVEIGANIRLLTVTNFSSEQHDVLDLSQILTLGTGQKIGDAVSKWNRGDGWLGVELAITANGGERYLVDLWNLPAADRIFIRTGDGLHVL